LYIVSFFLHFSARIEGIAVIRPDLILVIVISVSLLTQSSKLSGRLSNEPGKYLKYFLVYLALSLPLVEWPGSVLRSSVPDFVKAIIFFYFTVTIIDTHARLKLFINVFVFCQLFRVLEPLYLNLTEGYTGSVTFIGESGFVGRLAGAPSDVINPNGLAFVIVIVFCFIHYLWGSSRFRLKMMYFLTIPALLYALLLTLSRSGFLALVVGGWDIFLKSKRKMTMIILALVTLGILWNNMSYIQRDRYLSLIGGSETASAKTAQSRISGFTKSFTLVKNNPLFGYGIGTSFEAFYNVSRQAHVSHIFYMEAWIETGLIGLIILMLFVFAIYKSIKETQLLLKAFESTLDGNSMNQNMDIIHYYTNFNSALHSCFWVYLIFSFAQYGISEFHWYLLAALAILVNKEIKKIIPIEKEKPTA
jgi:O-Antigen ligase